MRNKFLSIVLSLLLAAPACVLRADETEIPLMETLTVGYISGDEPLDSPIGGDELPPNPNQFRATLCVRTLSITSLVAAGIATVVVLDHHGEIVYNQNMYFPSAYTVRQIIADNWNSGDYTFSISTIGHCYQGFFVLE